MFVEHKGLTARMNLRFAEKYQEGSCSSQTKQESKKLLDELCRRINNDDYNFNMMTNIDICPKVVKLFLPEYTMKTTIQNAFVNFSITSNL
jgi:hypothetical protein